MKKIITLIFTIMATASIAFSQSDLSDLINTPLDQDLPSASRDAANDQAPVSGDGFEYTGSGTLEYHGTNLDVRDVFGTLRLLTQRNIVVAQDVKAKFSGDLYDMTFEEAIEVICLATGLSASQRGSFLFIENTMLETKVFVLNHSRAEDIKDLIEDMLIGDEKVTASASAAIGIGSDEENAGGDAYASNDVIFVRANAGTMRAIEEMIKKVDGPPRQVLIEATILTADMVYSKELGVDVSVLQSLSFQDLNATSNGFGISTGNITADQMGNSVHQLQTDFTSDVSDGGLNLGLFRGDVAAFVRALQTVTDTTVLAQPSIMALNKQRGEVLLGRRDGFLTTTITQTGTTQQVEFLETGTRLLFRPFIGENGLIRMEIHPEDSEGGLNSLGLPFEITAELTTNILVKSGRTVLIGGLFREKSTTTEKGVPGLSSIPFLGKAFGSDVDAVEREEIIVLLTPTIIDADTYGEEFSSDDPVALQELVGKSPKILQDMYLRASKTLANEGQLGSALVMLKSAGKADSDSLEARRIRGKVQEGLVPEFSGSEVDRRIMEALLNEVGSH
ncbi:MAG: secretin N-terminal domain-containing protein [Planctomycetota bacterium]